MTGGEAERGGKAAADETAGDEEAVTEPEDKTAETAPVGDENAKGETAVAEDKTRWRRKR
jgi:hypothetical protein